MSHDSDYVDRDTVDNDDDEWEHWFGNGTISEEETETEVQQQIFSVDFEFVLVLLFVVESLGVRGSSRSE